MIFIDSSVWIDYFSRQPTPATRYLDQLLDKGERTLVIGDLVLLEVLQGFRLDEDFEAAKGLLTLLEIYALGGEQLVVRAAENCRLLRKKGVTIVSSIDVLIATFCIWQDFELLHNDGDFDRIRQHLPLRIAQSA